MTKSNYFDQNENYINVENLSLAEIYLRGSEEGFKKGYTDGQLDALHHSKMEKRLNTTDEMTLETIIKIVNEFKKDIEEASSEYVRQQIKLIAFHAIVNEVDWNQSQKKQKIPDEARELIEEERLLDDRDGTITGRAHE